MYLGDSFNNYSAYQYSGAVAYPTPYGVTAADYGKASSAEGQYQAHFTPCGYPGHPGAYPGPFPYSLDEIAAASRLSVYSGFNKGKNGRAKGEVYTVF